MAADFFFHDPTFEVMALRPLADGRWKNLKNPDVQYAIAAEEQYLDFHRYMLRNLRHTRAGSLSQPPYAYELGLSVRAGAVKAAVLVAASIVEAALRALAELRNYPLNKDPRRRTFGNVISAWEDGGLPRADVAHVWAKIRALHVARNFVHLHKAVGSPDAAWGAVLKEEGALLDGALDVIEHVSRIEA